MKTRSCLLFCWIILFVFTACAPETAPTASTSPGSLPTSTSQPTATDISSSPTPLTTATAQPTATDISSSPTPLATATAQPTATLTPVPTPDFMKEAKVGDYTLTLACMGSGSPTIILENGLENVSWDNASLARISPLTRTCTYLRAGMGPNDPKPEHIRTTADQVDDLHTLLQSTGVSGPYILVGHSIGAWNALYYTYRYPDEVVGVVFVDGAPAGWQQIYLDKFNSAGKGIEYMNGIQKWAVRYLERDPDAIFSGNQENVDVRESEKLILKVTSIGDIPLRLLVAPPPAHSPIFFDGNSWDVLNGWLWESSVLEADMNFLKLSTRPKLIAVPSTDHGTIVKAREVWEQISEVFQLVKMH